jgi:putative component of toxin-antitoxin plasmid stabilization module
MRNILAAILLLLTQTAFADIIYLKDGNEIKDAKIVKIGVSEVEYKIGNREVLYTAKKSDIAIIFYADGSKETFKDDGSSSEKQAPIIVNTNVNQNTNQNTNVTVGVPVAVAKEPPPTRCGFTAGERWGTWFLNVIPGLGSVAVMDDWTGATVQWGIIGGVALIGGIVGVSNNKETYHVGGAIVGIFLGYFPSQIWNSYRSYSYCKPGSVACRDNGKSGFNFALLPTHHGTILPAVTYSRRF